jgi:hypothetical protein
MLVDNILLAVILLGFGLGVIAVAADCLSFRSHQVATLKAAVDLRSLYQRAAKKTKLLAMRRRRT